MRVLQVRCNDLLADDSRRDERVLSLGDHGNPSALLLVVDIDRDDSPLRRGEICSNEKIVAGVADEIVSRIEPVDQTNDGITDLRLSRIVAEESVVETISLVGPLRDRDDCERSVVAYLSIEQPVGLILLLVYQLVGCLRLSNSMVVDLLVTVPVRKRIPTRRLGVPLIEKSLVVFRPRYSRELYPLEIVGHVATVVDAANVDLFPIRSTRRGCIGEHMTVGRGLSRTECHRAIC